MSRSSSSQGISGSGEVEVSVRDELPPIEFFLEDGEEDFGEDDEEGAFLGESCVLS